MVDKLLYSPEEARNLIGVGIKKFKALGIPARIVGKTKKYSLDDLKLFVNRLEKEEVCPSAKGKGRRSGNTTSRSGDKDFEEVRRHLIRERQGHSKRGNEIALYLVTNENPA